MRSVRGLLLTALLGMVVGGGVVALVRHAGPSSDVGADVRPVSAKQALGGEGTSASTVIDGPERRQVDAVTGQDLGSDLVLKAILGGACTGGHSFNVVVTSANVSRHWLKVRLIATGSHSRAMGARIQVDLKAKDGEVRSIYRTIGNNSSFGGNSLVEMIGLGDATYADQVTVSWPLSRKTELFHKITADQVIEIIEGAGSYRVIHQKVLAVPVPSA